VAGEEAFVGTISSEPANSASVYFMEWKACRRRLFLLFWGAKPKPFGSDKAREASQKYMRKY